MAKASGKPADTGVNDNSAKPKSAKDQKTTATAAAQATTPAVATPVAVAVPVALATNASAAPSAPAPGSDSLQAVRPANDSITTRTGAAHAQPDTQASAKQIAFTQSGHGQSVAANPGNAVTAVRLASATPAAAQPGAVQPANATPSDPQAALQAAAAAVPAHPSQPVQVQAAKPSQPLPVQSASAAPAAAFISGGHNAGAQDQGNENRNNQNQTAQRQAAQQGPSALAKPAPHAAIQTASTQAASTAPQDSTAQLAQSSAPLTVPAALQVTLQAPVHRNAASGSADQTVPLNDLSALAVTIAQKSQAGINQFDISLHPAELGSIHVQLTVDHNGTAQAHLTAANPQTLALLQNDSPSLQRALSDAGLNLSNSGLSFSLQGQEQQSGQSNQDSFAGGRARALSVSAVATTTVSAANANYSLAPDGVRLDIRV